MTIFHTIPSETLSDPEDDVQITLPSKIQRFRYKTSVFNILSAVWEEFFDCGIHIVWNKISSIMEKNKVFMLKILFFDIKIRDCQQKGMISIGIASKSKLDNCEWIKQIEQIARQEDGFTVYRLILPENVPEYSD